MKNSIKLFLLVLLANTSSIVSAAPVPPPPPPGPGTSTGSQGAPASPIDMYLYQLAIVAFGFMWYYHSKTRKTLG